MVNPNICFSDEEERLAANAAMDLRTIADLKTGIVELIKDAASRLNYPHDEEPAHEGIINVLQHLEEEFSQTIARAEELSGEVYNFAQ
jgi:hypothetical protein